MSGDGAEVGLSAWLNCFEQQMNAPTLLSQMHALVNLPIHQSLNVCVCNSLLKQNTIQSSKVEGWENDGVTRT